ncbi:MAG: hypothetical protein HC794_02765, partial [Nitrospiraceae bacterium]|nr:hypothetical protein [Nitrospiraceae bacterium]
SMNARVLSFNAQSTALGDDLNAHEELGNLPIVTDDAVNQEDDVNVGDSVMLLGDGITAYD